MEGRLGHLVLALLWMVTVGSRAADRSSPTHPRPRIACAPWVGQSLPAGRPGVALHSPEDSPPFAGEARELVPETYRSWEGETYTMFAFEGAYVRISVPTNDFPLLGKVRMEELVDRCDRLYCAMRELLGWEPGGDGRLGVALAVNTCGSGCGVVGGKGIEVEVDFQAYGAERIDGAYEAVWAILIHEMAHNFDPLSGPIFYTSDPAHAWTSFLSFYALVAEGGGTTEHYPPYQKPGELLDTMVEHFFDPYLRDEASTWAGCISGGDCAFASPETGSAAKQRGAQGGLLLKYARTAGYAATRRMLRHLVGRVLVSPDSWVSRSPQDKADLMVEAMSVGLGESAVALADRWKWGVSAGTRAALSRAFVGPSILRRDQDGDGVTVDEGDCDDLNPTVYPRLAPAPYDRLPDCGATLPALPEIEEDGDYPGFEAEPTGVQLPIEIVGVGEYGGDVDRWVFDLPERRQLKFSLTSLGTWDGWCFFDHTREYGVRAEAGRTGTLIVALGPGRIGIRTEPVVAEAEGGYRLRIEEAGDGTEGRWLEPANDCAVYARIPALLEESDAPDQSPVGETGGLPAVRLPSQVVGQICTGDSADWYSVTVDKPTYVRINLQSESSFKGWVFLPGNDLVYCPAGSSGGGIFRLPTGTNAFRVVPQDAEGGRYRVILQREDPAFLEDRPPERGPADGAWNLRTGPMESIGADGEVTVRFWVSGLGWAGASAVQRGEASMAFRLPPDADPAIARYRFQLHREGVPASPFSRARRLGAATRELPVSLEALGLVPSDQEGKYDATFRVVGRESSAFSTAVEVRFDGQAVLEFASVPEQFTLKRVSPGLHGVRLVGIGADSPLVGAACRLYPFAVFHSAELNVRTLVPGSANPADLRSIRRLQNLSVRRVPSEADLRVFEALREISTTELGAGDASRLLGLDGLRRIVAPADRPIVVLSKQEARRVRVRGASFGRAAVLQQSGDLRDWSDLPYSGNPDANEILEVDVPASGERLYYRLIAR